MNVQNKPSGSTNPFHPTYTDLMLGHFRDLIQDRDAANIRNGLDVYCPTANDVQRLIDEININDNTTSEVMDVLTDYLGQLRTADEFAALVVNVNLDAAALIIIQLAPTSIHAISIIVEYLRGESAIAQRLIQFSANQGDPILARFLLERGLVAVNARDGERQYTPLHTAAVNGRAEVVKHLLEHGARPSITDARGRTPLQLIEENCRMELDVFVRIRELLTTRVK